MRSAFFTAVLLSAACGWTDTIMLNTGVVFDAKVTKQPNGIYLMEAGGNKVFYRQNEIKSIEKNAKTGAFDKEAAMAEWKKVDAELTKKTGLNAKQREEVTTLMYQLQNEDPAVRLSIREKLIGLQSQFNVFDFMKQQLPTLSPKVAPGVLETLYYLNADKARPVIRENIANTYFGTRVKAIEMLAKMRDVESLPQIARGLADATPEVRMITIYAMAALDNKAATPALLEIMAQNDQRLSNASRDSLLELWKVELAGKKPANVEEWKTFWTEHAGLVKGNALQLASLQPLVSPHEEFQNE